MEKGLTGLITLKFIKMRILKLQRLLIYFSCILFIIALFSCETKQYPRGLTEGEFKLLMTTYSKAWIDGANASTDSQNTIGYFNDSIGRIELRKDSLAFIGILYGN